MTTPIINVTNDPRPAIIAVVGAHGTGKTTLVKQLKTSLVPSHYGFSTSMIIPDVARIQARQGTLSNPAAQRRIFAERLRHEVDASGLVISDGCLLDNYAHYEHWCGPDEPRRRKALMAFTQYDLIFYLPADPTLCVADGIRPTDLAFQVEIDRKFRALMASADRSVNALPFTSTGERHQLVLEQIQIYFKDTFCRQVPLVFGFLISAGRLLLSRSLEAAVPAADDTWDAVGGAIEFGEQPEQTLRRECEEEIGIRPTHCEFIPLVTTFVWQRQRGRFQSIISAYICDLPSPPPDLHPRVAKIGELRWFTRSELSNINLIASLRPYLPHILPRLSP
jgi:8-oxo-dGTP pyrophosphatase MutT (NUDIX family)/nicotinamide riboside kinase